MKVKQLINVLGALNDTGKLACDMYSLDESEYYSQSQGAIAISEMEFTHVLRAFRKICDDDVRIDTQEGKVKDLEKQVNHWKKLAEANFISSVNDLETSDIWKERYEKEVSKAEYWKDLWNTRVDNLRELPKGCGYAFSEIPNDTDGQEFVDTMKQYLNKDSYKMRVRGQHIKPELRGTGATYWGQSKAESTHMRIYIDKKKGE